MKMQNYEKGYLNLQVNKQKDTEQKFYLNMFGNDPKIDTKIGKENRKCEVKIIK